MSKKSTKLIVIVIAGVILLTLIALFLVTEVIPRAIVISREKPKNIRYDDMQKVEIEGDYQGEAETVGTKGVFMDLPYDTETDEDLYVYDSGLTAEIRKYDYQILISRIEGEALHKNAYHDEELRYLYLDTKSYYEYLAKILEYDFEEPSILLAPGELKIKYRVYSYLESYWSDGNYYGLVERGGFALAVRISDRQKGNEQFHNLYISIYDIENEYDFVAEISIHKNFMSFDEIAYIVDSIKIEEY